jgi:hypothetical protein
MNVKSLGTRPEASQSLVNMTTVLNKGYMLHKILAMLAMLIKLNSILDIGIPGS